MPGPLTPPPPLPSVGRRASTSITRPKTVFTNTRALAPARNAASATSRSAGVLGLSFTQRGRPAASERRLDDLTRRRGGVREDLASTFQVGTAGVHFERHHVRAEHRRGGVSELVDGPAPNRTDHGDASCEQSGQILRA